MTLLSPDPTRTAPKASIAAPDRAPDWVADGTPEPLRSELVALLGEDRVHARAIDIVRYASDASPYRMLPQVVLAPRDLADMVKLFGYARRSRKPLVFRAGGTSLNGQAQTSSILVDVRRHWQRARIEAGGERARVQPGIVLGRVNALLARHGRRLGPDPASSDIACIGGVIANNSGGMRCGVTADSYRTVASMTFALANGAVIDTAAPDAERHFAQAAPELAAGLEQIRDEIRADPELSERIARKFEIKNTTGYRLCAFLDADTPLEIFRRLIVGSEGTLALIGEAVLETFPLRPQTAISLAYFADVDSAAAAVPGLVAAGATATELMVAPTLIAAAWNMPGTPVRWKELPPDSAALLVEFSAAQVSELDALERRGLEILSGCELIDPARFSREHEEIEMLWRVREGMQGLLAAMRPPGVSLIIEDVCFPPQRIAEGAKDLQRLLGEHGFLHGVAGHASAGNLHFLLTPNFGQPADLERYEAFMHELVELIVDKYDGSLKAEHGTGVNMAPYVARGWGPRATDLMWRIKELADPDFILGPGVVLNRDPGVHLRNLKSTPEIEATATKCIECGFCEPVCPSRNNDDHSPPADRGPARDGPPAPVLAAAGRAARAVRARRHPDLRGRRHLQLLLPGWDRHRHADQGAPPPGAHAARGGSRVAPGPALRGGRARRAGRPARGAPRRERARPACRGRDPRRGAAPCQHRSGADLARQHATGGAGTAPRHLARRYGRGVPARVYQPDLWQPRRPRLTPDPARGTGGGLGARGTTAVDPR